MTARGGYFEGWYFKHQTEGRTVAFIPARHIDEQGRRSASVQIITDGCSACTEFPYESFQVNRRNGLFITVGPNHFSLLGADVELDAGGLTVRGELRYRAIKPPRYDIMGPFRFFPMQCRHSVLSIRHSVSGALVLNGETVSFENATGYIEGDSGRSFPARYIWTQCVTDGDKPASIMLSVADIPFAGLRFTGVIGFVYMEGKERRIATYLGAIPVETKRGAVAVRQGKWLLRAELLAENPTPLRAPVHGGMTRMIHESAACRARYTLFENGRTLFDFVSDRAGFESEYGL
ncbi:MAG: tocopherol cyclase family protein [Bacillota bacterium]